MSKLIKPANTLIIALIIAPILLAVTTSLASADPSTDVGNGGPNTCPPADTTTDPAGTSYDNSKYYQQRTVSYTPSLNLKTVISKRTTGTVTDDIDKSFKAEKVDVFKWVCTIQAPNGFWRQTTHDLETDLYDYKQWMHEYGLAWISKTESVRNHFTYTYFGATTDKNGYMNKDSMDWREVPYSPTLKHVYVEDVVLNRGRTERIPSQVGPVYTSYLGRSVVLNILVQRGGTLSGSYEVAEVEGNGAYCIEKIWNYNVYNSNEEAEPSIVHSGCTEELLNEYGFTLQDGPSL